MEKKYEEVTVDNDRLRAQLTEKISEIIEIYRTSSSEKLGGDFSQMMLQQTNQKQRVLVDENARLERERAKSTRRSPRSTWESWRSARGSSNRPRARPSGQRPGKSSWIRRISS